MWCFSHSPTRPQSPGERGRGADVRKPYIAGLCLPALRVVRRTQSPVVGQPAGQAAACRAHGPWVESQQGSAGGTWGSCCLFHGERTFYLPLPAAQRCLLSDGGQGGSCAADSCPCGRGCCNSIRAPAGSTSRQCPAWPCPPLVPSAAPHLPVATLTVVSDLTAGSQTHKHPQAHPREFSFHACRRLCLKITKITYVYKHTCAQPEPEEDRRRAAAGRWCRL